MVCAQVRACVYVRILLGCSSLEELEVKVGGKE